MRLNASSSQSRTARERGPEHREVRDDDTDDRDPEDQVDRTEREIERADAPGRRLDRHDRFPGFSETCHSSTAARARIRAVASAAAPVGADRRVALAPHGALRVSAAAGQARDPQVAHGGASPRFGDREVHVRHVGAVGHRGDERAQRGRTVGAKRRVHVGDVPPGGDRDEHADRCRQHATEPRVGAAGAHAVHDVGIGVELAVTSRATSSPWNWPSPSTCTSRSGPRSRPAR